EFDLVLTGSQSDDLGFTATGSLLAAELAWPHAWLVMGVEIEEGGRSVRVTREMESGRNEISRIALPAVLQIQAGLNHPRYASLKGIMQAKKKPIETIDAAGLGLAAGDVGAAGSRTELLGIEVPTTSDAAELLEGDMAA